MKELLARVKALLRRSQAVEPEVAPEIYQRGLRVDFRRAEVRRARRTLGARV